MSDDSLRAIWTLDPSPVSREALITAMNAVLDEDQAARDKDRSVHILGVCALALLCPALLWCAAYGIHPLVRAGYALMAAGTAILVSTGMVVLQVVSTSLARAGRLGFAIAENCLPPVPTG